MIELPTGWEMIRLGDCLEKLKSGKLAERGWSPQCLNHPVKDEDAWGVLKTTSVQMGVFQPQYNKQLPKTLKPKIGLEVNLGDFLLTTTGPRNRCGIICLAKITPKKLIFSGKILRFRANESVITSAWLLFLLMSPEYQKMFDAMKVGTSDSSVSIGNQQVLDLQIPVPSIDEQHKIVEILEDHLSRLDATSEYLKISKRMMGGFRRSLMATRFEDLKAPRRELGNLIREPLRNGNSSKASQTSSGVRTLTLTAITKRSFEDEFTKLTVADPNKVKNLWLEPGDVLIQRSNTPDLVGSSALYDGVSNWAIFPDLLIRVRPDRDLLLPEFLDVFLQSSESRNFFRSAAKGVSGSMPKIDQGTIERLLVPAPSIVLQRNFVEEMNEVFNEVNRLDITLDFLIARVSSVRFSLLQAAFTGQLTREAINV